MRGWQITGYGILSIWFCCMIAIGSGCGDPKPIPIVNVDDSTDDTSIESGKDVYVTDNMNDENSAMVTEPSTTVSYWYIYYDVHIVKGDSRYQGWKVISLPTPYFDTYKAVRILVPTFVDEDYVGIQFFKRVPIETYTAFLKDEKP